MNINPNIYAAETMQLVLDRFENWIRLQESEGRTKISTEDIKKIIYKLRLNSDKLKI